VESSISVQVTLSSVQGYISTLPAVDRPEAFGQHANAEIAFRIEETAGLLDGLIGLQPSVEGAGHAAGREEEVLRITQEVMEQVNGGGAAGRERERERKRERDREREREREREGVREREREREREEERESQRVGLHRWVGDI
jgi:hypothetical protein